MPGRSPGALSSVNPLGRFSPFPICFLQEDLPKAEMVSHMKLESGARCLVKEGKHSGKVVTLREILKRKGGKRPEVLVEDESGSFETVLDYLFVVGKDFEVAK